MVSLVLHLVSKVRLERKLIPLLHVCVHTLTDQVKSEEKSGLTIWEKGAITAHLSARRYGGKDGLVNND